VLDQTVLGDFFGIHSYTAHTAEKALYGNSLGAFLSYHYIYNNYLNGAGMGSCYIAEAYADLKLIGVILVNIFYGIVLSKIPKWFSSNILLSIISFFILSGIYLAPRSGALDFMSHLLGPTNILIVVVLFSYAKYSK
jgi:hypothetical protein